MKADVCSRSEWLGKDLLGSKLTLKALSRYRLSSLFYCEKTTHPELQSFLHLYQLEADEPILSPKRRSRMSVLQVSSFQMGLSACSGLSSRYLAYVLLLEGIPCAHFALMH